MTLHYNDKTANSVRENRNSYENFENHMKLVSIICEQSTKASLTLKQDDHTLNITLPHDRIHS
jgi:hypothetical protein